jgi:hypothetical protein
MNVIAKLVPAPIPMDIETGPQADEVLLALRGAFNPDNVSLGNLRDPLKIEEKIEAARRSYLPDLRQEACLDPLIGKVMAIGFRTPAGRIVILDGHADERLALSSFWRMADEMVKHGFEGWNLFNFDLDYLRMRSLILRVAVPSWVAKYAGSFLSYREHFTDLMVEVTGSPKKYLKLDYFARAIGLEGKSHATSGADFWKDWTSADPTRRTAAATYLTGDVEQTGGVGEWLREARALHLPMPRFSPNTQEDDVPWDFPTRGGAAAAA